LQPIPDVDDPTAVSYRAPVSSLTADESLVIAGQPTVTIRGTTTGPRVQLNVRLFDVANGRKELITRGTYTVDGVAPLGAIEVTIPTAGNLWRISRDHVLQLEITSNDTPYIAASKVASVTQISEVKLTLPVR